MTKEEVISLHNEAKNGNVEAMEALGSNYFYGRNGFPCDMALSVHWFERAAYLHSKTSANRLAHITRFFVSCIPHAIPELENVPSEETHILAYDPNLMAKSVEYNFLAAYLGNPYALEYVNQQTGSDCHLSFPEEGESLYNWLIEYVDLGNNIAPYLLGKICCDQAVTLPKSDERTKLFEEAYEWFSLAADYGHARSYFMLTKIICELDADLKEVLRESIPYWYRKAASLGDPLAQYEYAAAHSREKNHDYYLFAALHGIRAARQVVVQKRLSFCDRKYYPHYFGPQQILNKTFSF